MGWVRLGQLTGETGSAADVSGFGSTVGLTVTTAQKYTGARGYAVASLNTGGLEFPVWTDTARAGFMFRYAGMAGSGAVGVCGFRVDGANFVWAFNPTASEIYLRIGNLYSSPNGRFAGPWISSALNQVNKWYNVGMVARIAANGFSSFYVDGMLAARFDGDTRCHRSYDTVPRTQISGFMMGGQMYGGSTSLSAAYADDIYCDRWEGPGEVVDAPPPTRRFLVAKPIGVGASSQWTPDGGGDNFAKVNQVPPDDDASFLKANGPGLLDLYAFEDVAIPEDHTLRALIPMALARKSDAAAPITIRLVASDGQTQVESDEQPLSVSYGYSWYRWLGMPDGYPLTQEGVDSLQYGVKSSGDFGGA